MTGRFFIVSITERNWLVTRRENVYGVPASSRRDVRSIVKPGDYLVFYVPKKGSEKLGGKIVGVYRVVSEWFEGRELLWPDEVESRTLRYAWRVRIEPVRVGEADFEKLVPELSFVKDKKRWGAFLVGTPGNGGKPIPPEDAEKILRALGSLSSR